MANCGVTVMSLLVSLTWVGAVPSGYKVSSVSTIACNNFQLLEYVISSNIAYKCLPGTGQKFETRLQPEQTFLSVNSDEFGSPEDSVESGETDPVSGRNSVVRTGPTDCAEGEIYLSEVGVCDKKPANVKLPNTGTKPKTKQSTQKTRTQERLKASEEKKPGKCKKNFVYLSELGMCVPKNVAFGRRKRSTDEKSGKAIRGFPSRAVYPALEIIEECNRGYAFDPNTGLCMPLYETSAVDRENMITRLQFLESKDEWTDVRERCAPGLVYISSIDMCTTHIKPTAEQIEHRMAAIEHERKQLELITTTEDPFRLKLSPLNSEHLGSRKCGPSAFYLSELDICV